MKTIVYLYNLTFVQFVHVQLFVKIIIPEFFNKKFLKVLGFSYFYSKFVHRSKVLLCLLALIIWEPESIALLNVGCVAPRHSILTSSSNQEVSEFEKLQVSMFIYIPCLSIGLKG